MAFALKGYGGGVERGGGTLTSPIQLVTTTTVGSIGDLAVLSYCIDNVQTTDGDESAIGTVTDTAGNTWTKAAEFCNGQGAAKAGTSTGLWYSNLTASLAIGATISLPVNTVASRTSHATTLHYFTLAGGSTAAVEGTPGTLASDAALAGSLDVTTSNIACLRIRLVGNEDNTSTLLTKTAAFTALLTQLNSVGNPATSGQTIHGEYAITTGTSLASAPTGGSGAVDGASVYVAFKEVSAATPVPWFQTNETGSTIAIAARKAAVATLIAASTTASFVPFNTRQINTQQTSRWQQPLSIAVPVAQARQGNAFVPFNTTQVVVTTVPSGWAAPLSVAAPVAHTNRVSRTLFAPIPLAESQVSAAIGVPLYSGNPLLARPIVYYQARIEPPYTAPVSGAYTNFYFQPLSVAPPVANAQQGNSFVPFNTAQLSVNFTNFGWVTQPPNAPAVARAQAGSSFVPFNTAQLSVNFTNFGWVTPLSPAPAVGKAQPGYSFVPYNTAQLLVNYTNFYFQPLSVAAPVARAQQGFAFVPFNTAQLSVNYTLFWQQGLSTAPAVASKATTGDFGSVPYYTVAPAVVATTLAWLGPLWTVPMKNLVVSNQSNFFVPYTVTAVVATTARRKPLLFISNVGRLMS